MPEHRHAELEEHRIRARAPSSKTLAGPPESTTAIGSSSASRSRLEVAALDHRLDPELAQPAGDQLGVLRTEVEDEDDLVVHCSTDLRGRAEHSRRGRPAAGLNSPVASG